MYTSNNIKNIMTLLKDNSELTPESYGAFRASCENYIKEIRAIYDGTDAEIIGHIKDNLIYNSIVKNELENFNNLYQTYLDKIINAEKNDNLPEALKQQINDDFETFDVNLGMDYISSGLQYFTKDNKSQKNEELKNKYQEQYANNYIPQYIEDKRQFEKRLKEIATLLEKNQLEKAMLHFISLEKFIGEKYQFIIGEGVILANKNQSKDFSAQNTIDLIQALYPRLQVQISEKQIYNLLFLQESVINHYSNNVCPNKDEDPQLAKQVPFLNQITTISKLLVTLAKNTDANDNNLTVDEVENKFGDIADKVNTNEQRILGFAKNITYTMSKVSLQKTIAEKSSTQPKLCALANEIISKSDKLLQEKDPKITVNHLTKVLNNTDAVLNNPSNMNDIQRFKNSIQPISKSKSTTAKKLTSLMFSFAGTAMIIGAGIMLVGSMGTSLPVSCALVVAGVGSIAAGAAPLAKQAGANAGMKAPFTLFGRTATEAKQKEKSHSHSTTYPKPSEYGAGPSRK